MTQERLMVSDLERMLSMYRRLGLNLVAEKPTKHDTPYGSPDGFMLTVEVQRYAESSRTIVGYGGFLTRYYFDSEGMLIRQGIWE